jgi:DNA gyrase/topoisomerase IV subunit A
VVFIDTTGRSYAIDPITLPSARGQGEPLTGKLTLPPGATVEHMLMESDDQKLLMAPTRATVSSVPSTIWWRATVPVSADYPAG